MTKVHLAWITWMKSRLRGSQRPGPVALLIGVFVLLLLPITPTLAQSAQSGASDIDPLRAVATSATELPQADLFWQVAVQARDGDPGAQFLLGGFFERGDGIAQDAEMAVMWWRKAAEQGHAGAQNELGTALAEGYGVTRDPAQAVQWYRRAAEQGLAIAQANLGTMYRDGTGVARNNLRAAEWYQKSADQGLGWAQFYLGDAYERGSGVRRNRVRAMEWFLKAARQEYTDAQFRLGFLYRLDPQVIADPDGASLEAYGEYWLALAARSGHEQARTDLESHPRRTCRPLQLPAGTAVLTHADEKASVIRHTQKDERACVLPKPSMRSPRLENWIAVYLPEGWTVGFVSTNDAGTR